MFKDADLNKGQLRKLNGFRTSVNGDEKSAQQMMKIYMAAQPKVSVAKVDPVAERIAATLEPLLKDKKFNLTRKGYTIKRHKGVLLVKKNA